MFNNHPYNVKECLVGSPLLPSPPKPLLRRVLMAGSSFASPRTSLPEAMESPSSIRNSPSEKHLNNLQVPTS
ncbi:unnamed protein product, partial [Nesidiocoris tenuis]